MDTARKLTYQEFLDRYDGPRAEWKNGEIVPMVACGYKHQRLVGFLHQVLGLGVEVRWQGVLLLAPFQMKTGLELPGREPDLLYLTPEGSARLKEQFLEGPAELAIEVVSPDSRLRDRGEKFAEYEMGGVREYWVLDPALERADFYQLQADGRYQSQPQPGGRYHSGVLPGLVLPVAWLWEHPPVLTCWRELGFLA